MHVLVGLNDEVELPHGQRPSRRHRSSSRHGPLRPQPLRNAHRAFTYKGKNKLFLFLADLEKCSPMCPAGTELDPSQRARFPQTPDLTLEPLRSASTFVGRDLPWYRSYYNQRRHALLPLAPGSSYSIIPFAPALVLIIQRAAGFLCAGGVVHHLGGAGSCF